MLWIDFVSRILAALLLGTIIGLDRQWRQRMAGLRTNALVSLGSALFVITSSMIQGEISKTRIASAVVSGIGFLCAGVIINRGPTIQSLNTAATLWCSAAVGVIAGMGFLLEATP